MINDSDTPKVFVQPGSYLTLHYRIQFLTGPAAGSVFVDTFDGRPATLQLGAGQWAPGMEYALIGREEGSQFSVELAAADAYGERNPDLIQRVTLDLLKAHSEPGITYQPGSIIEFSAPHGGRYSGVLKELGDTSALFDFNHPMAGADLRIDVSLLGVL